MLRFRRLTLSLALAGLVAALAGLSLTAQEPKPAPGAKDAKIDLSALRDAVDAASRKGANVDEVSKALDAFEKAAPNAKPGAVPPELQALRDAVDAASRKGENVEAVSKELLAVEMAVAGKSLARPRPEPVKPNPNPNPAFPNPGAFPNPVPFPNVPFPALPGAGGGLAGGIDVEMFNKAMELRRKALDLMVKNPRDPEVQKEAQKLQAEAAEILLKATKNLGGRAGGLGGIAPVMPALPEFPAFPGLDAGRVPDRARLGIRMERVPALTAEQLGLDANTGVAVTLVTPNSAAEKAGLKVHDIIVEFAGKPVSDNLEDFIRRVNEAKAGEKLDLVVFRKGKKVDVKGVVLPEAPKQPAAPRIDLPLPGLIPELPEARPQPAPAVPPPPALPGVAVAPEVPLPPRAPAGFDSLSYTAENQGFKVTALKGFTRYTLTGTHDAAGRAALTSVSVETSGKTTTAASLDKLEAGYKADVEALLKAVERK